MFYPADPKELQTMIDGFMRVSHREAGPAPKAIIAPHAGYIYSGPVAANAYAQLEPLRDTIKRVVLLGPSHRVPLIGLAATSDDYFHTPLGDIKIDQQAIEEILDLPQVKRFDAAHSMEHSLEVHLPFLQTVLSHFELVPLVVGEASAQEVAQVLERFWDDEQTLFVISSDLSHYHDYETARNLDRRTSDAIETLDYQHIGYEDACGRNPVSGLLYLARQKHLHITTLDLRNSGDTAGPRDQVVGYGAYMATADET
jgi:AmmeMemoRadiSam system protein B